MGMINAVLEQLKNIKVVNYNPNYSGLLTHRQNEIFMRSEHCNYGREFKPDNNDNLDALRYIVPEFACNISEDEQDLLLDKWNAAINRHFHVDACAQSSGKGWGFGELDLLGSESELEWNGEDGLQIPDEVTCINCETEMKLHINYDKYICDNCGFYIDIEEYKMRNTDDIKEQLDARALAFKTFGRG